MKLSVFSILPVVFCATHIDKSVPETPEPEPALPCTVVSPAKAFYDLSGLSRPNTSPKTPGMEKPASWTARGFDYDLNFTIGVCASPLSGASIKNSHDIDLSVLNASMIGGFYTGRDGIKYSIGNYNTTPIFRGKKMLLTYTNGSYCRDQKGNVIKDSTGQPIRKLSLLSFTCDKEILQRAVVSFIGVLNDCDYFFEVRTPHACVTPKKADDLAALWIFMFILFAALCVYFSGGFLYKTLFKRAGWSQLGKGMKNNVS